MPLNAIHLLTLLQPIHTLIIELIIKNAINIYKVLLMRGVNCFLEFIVGVAFCVENLCCTKKGETASTISLSI